LADRLTQAIGVSRHMLQSVADGDWTTVVTLEAERAALLDRATLTASCELPADQRGSIGELLSQCLSLNEQLAELTALHLSELREVVMLRQGLSPPPSIPRRPQAEASKPPRPWSTASTSGHWSRCRPSAARSWPARNSPSARSCAPEWLQSGAPGQPVLMLGGATLAMDLPFPVTPGQSLDFTVLEVKPEVRLGVVRPGTRSRRRPGATARRNCSCRRKRCC
jgi:hypothetical protein